MNMPLNMIPYHWSINLPPDAATSSVDPSVVLAITSAIASS
ncbi:hypothetical protein PC129_g20719 [Phytophthora cactorum]|uniref:Uncharacterized protein n=1 Tax=Phytophthora cactorum TaxID=29920 RepID=A0A329RUM4_9STRA|nr:hypothetical protein PC111_g20778 [Phytophthora cactorum]KAG2798693.1 hypothetical protein PC112_g21240 [Phytophthora cactorum]KAG2854562.1 hypothetical protein PC113_g13209 [Phytophthora cactorum]KAG2885521.1 hypothetical protein PC115_g20985 [Phytophthora cactorum]KAG2895155.1 hypothetical protein PC117_g23314 [Phytophthora cactorum]